jgi:hypothetical protein
MQVAQRGYITIDWLEDQPIHASDVKGRSKHSVHVRRLCICLVLLPKVMLEEAHLPEVNDLMTDLRLGSRHSIRGSHRCFDCGTMLRVSQERWSLIRKVVLLWLLGGGAS